MSKFNEEAYNLAKEVHRAQWNSRAQAREAILAHYGVTADWSGKFGSRIDGGIADHWNRKVRLELNSSDGWGAATSGSIWKAEDFGRFALECREVEDCLKALHAIGDVGIDACPYLPLSVWMERQG